MENNVIILGRILGVKASQGTCQTDSDLRNPNIMPPKDGVEAMVATLEDMGFSDPRYVTEAIVERLDRHGYWVAAKEKVRT